MFSLFSFLKLNGCESLCTVSASDDQLLSVVDPQNEQNITVAADGCITVELSGVAFALQRLGGTGGKECSFEVEVESKQLNNSWSSMGLAEVNVQEGEAAVDSEDELFSTGWRFRFLRPASLTRLVASGRIGATTVNAARALGRGMGLSAQAVEFAAASLEILDIALKSRPASNIPAVLPVPKCLGPPGIPLIQSADTPALGGAGDTIESTNHGEASPPIQIDPIPIEYSVSHSIPSVKPIECSIPDVNVIEHSLTDMKPIEHSITDMKPIEHSITDMKPIERSITDVKDIERIIPDVTHIEHSIPDAKPIERSIPDVKPIERSTPDEERIEYCVPEVEHIEPSIPGVKLIERSIPDVKPIERSIPDVELSDRSVSGTARLSSAPRIVEIVDSKSPNRSKSTSPDASQRSDNTKRRSRSSSSSRRGSSSSSRRSRRSSSSSRSSRKRRRRSYSTRSRSPSGPPKGSPEHLRSVLANYTRVVAEGTGNKWEQEVRDCVKLCFAKEDSRAVIKCCEIIKEMSCKIVREPTSQRQLEKWRTNGVDVLWLSVFMEMSEGLKDLSKITPEIGLRLSLSLEFATFCIKAVTNLVDTYSMQSLKTIRSWLVEFRKTQPGTQSALLSGAWKGAGVLLTQLDRILVPPPCEPLSWDDDLRIASLVRFVEKNSPIPVDSEKKALNVLIAESPSATKWGALMQITVSLCCPLSKARLGVPARGMACRHVQCFDLRAFFDEALRACPICGDELTSETVYISETMRAILRRASGMNIAHMRSDGSFEVAIAN